MDCPILWNRIVITPRSRLVGIAEVLRQSRKSPLTVLAHFGGLRDFSIDTQSADAFELVLKETSRIRVLDVSGSDRLSNDPSQVMGGPTSMLETVRRGGPLFYCNNPSSSTRMMQCQTFLTSGNSVSLRRLELMETGVVWTDVVAPSLTYLKLCHLGDYPKLADFLTALERMPLLDTIYLDHAGPTPKLAGSPTTLKDVTLPCLRSFHMNVIVPRECIGLLSHLSLPELRSLSLDIICGLSAEDAQELVSYVSIKILPLIHHVRMLAVELHWNFLSIIGYDDSDLRLLYDRSSDSEDSPLVISTPWRNHRVALPLLTRDISFTFTHTLHVSNLRFASPHQWHDTFGTLANISVLNVHRGTCGEHLPAALADRGVGLDSTTRTPFLRNLRILRFDTVRFCGDENYRRGRIRLTRLVDALMVCCECGIGIEKLELVNCINFSESDYTLLREALPTLDVCWDRGVKICDDDDEGYGVYFVHKDLDE